LGTRREKSHSLFATVGVARTIERDGRVLFGGNITFNLHILKGNI